MSLYPAIGRCWISRTCAPVLTSKLEISHIQAYPNAVPTSRSFRLYKSHTRLEILKINLFSRLNSYDARFRLTEKKEEVEEEEKKKRLENISAPLDDYIVVSRDNEISAIYFFSAT